MQRENEVKPVAQHRADIPRAAPKVLFITESRGYSGGARQLLALARGLSDFDWKVTLACPAGGQTYQKAVEQGLDVVDFFPRQDYDVASALKLVRIIGERGIDILHAHHPRAHAVGLIAAYLSARRPKFVVTRRVSFPLSKNPFSRFKYRSSRVDGFIAVAESIRSLLIEGGVAADKVTTIPSGVDFETFTPRTKDAALAKEWKLPKDAAVIGLAANYGSWKGQDVFLQAAGLLKKQGRKCVFLLAGRDTQHPDLKRMAQEAGLSDDDVRFLGFYEDVPRLLSVFDVSVNASTSGEGISGAIRESLAMGIPVVASDIGGNREIVSDGVTGRLFAAGKPEALAKAVADVLADSGSAKKMSEAGREAVRKKFGTERMVESTARFYEGLLARAVEAPREIFQYVC